MPCAPSFLIIRVGLQHMLNTQCTLLETLGRMIGVRAKQEEAAICD